VDQKRREIKQLVYRWAEKEKEREKAGHTASPPKRKHSDDGAVRSDEKKLTTSGIEEASQDVSSSKRRSKRRKVATVQEPTGIPFPFSFCFAFFLNHSKLANPFKRRSWPNRDDVVYLDCV